MSLSSKHFEDLADIVADVDRHGVITALDLAHRLADLCAIDDPNFDRGRFLYAALDREQS